MPYFVRHGSSFSVSSSEALDLYEALPTATYTVKFDQMSGSYYLEIIDDLVVQGKIYGDTERDSLRILNTFMDRPNSTGVMLTGEKGSGKTLLAKKLSVDGKAQGIPTIVINAPWCGEVFNSFIQTIEQPTIIVFDEFEKVYDREEQDKLLTLLDGVYPSKKLFVITSNDKYRINEHMRNRPGRIFYRLDYVGLSSDFIIEYCNDVLINKSHIDSIVKISLMFGSFNFDILKALVEEMNRYDESPTNAIRLLNAKPEQEAQVIYNLKLSLNDGTKIDHAPQVNVNPFAPVLSFYYDKADNESDEDFKINFSTGDLHKMDAAIGEFVFTNEFGSATLTKNKPAHFDMAQYIL